MPIYKNGVNAYDWVRMSEFDFGGSPGALRWMGLFDSLFPRFGTVRRGTSLIRIIFVPSGPSSIKSNAPGSG